MPSSPISPRRGRGERGSLSVWVAMMMPALIVVVGLGVDFAGHATAQSQARQVAAQAARSGGQQIRLTARGEIVLDAPAALAQANSFAARSGMDAGARVVGDVVQVQVSSRYHCLFLGVIGIDSLNVEASARARAIPALEGRPA